MSLPRSQPVPSGNHSVLWPVLSAFRQIYRFVSDYYDGNDLLPLSRQRHREQIIYYRKACTKLASVVCLFGLLLLLSSLRTCHAATAIQSSNTTTAMAVVIDSSKWQPDNFDWETKRALSGPKETWKGLYVNLTDNEHAASSVLTTDVALYITNSAITSDLTIFNGTGPRTEIIPVLAWFAGMSWTAVSEGALTGLAVASTISAIEGGVTDDGSAWADYNCIVALVSSVVSIGQAARGAYLGAKALGWFARSSAMWRSSGLEAIELSAFLKRELHPDQFQIICEQLISHELMDLAVREHLTGTRFTISYTTGLEKRGLHHLGSRKSFPARAAEQRDLGRPLR